MKILVTKQKTLPILEGKCKDIINSNQPVEKTKNPPTLSWLLDD